MNSKELEFATTINRLDFAASAGWAGLRFSGHLTQLGVFLSHMDFSRVSLSRAKLEGVDMSNSNFFGAYMDQSRLTRCNIDGCNFSQSLLSDAGIIETAGENGSFYKSNLRSIRIEKTQLLRFNFDECNLSGATFGGSNLKDCTFRKALFSRSNRYSHRAPTQVGGTFTGCDFAEADMRHVVFDGWVFQDAHLTEALLTGSNFSGAAFVGLTTWPDGVQDNEIRWEEFV